jgi:hypothetical protein
MMQIESNQNSRTRWRPRLSLLSSLLLMTIIGLAIVVAQLWREVNPLRTDIFRLRQELGYLSIADETKIYAIQVPGPQPDVSRYRIFLPKNRQFMIKTRLFNIPGKKPKQSRQEWLASLQGSGMSTSIDSGEQTIDVSVRPDAATKDQWLLSFQSVGRAGGGTSGTVMPWMNDRRAWQVNGEISIGQQKEFNPDDGVVVFALRQGVVKKIKGGYSTIGADETKDTPGVMLWIAPAQKGE